MNYKVYHCVSCRLCFLDSYCTSCRKELFSVLINEPIRIKNTVEGGVTIRRLKEINNEE